MKITQSSQLCYLSFKNVETVQNLYVRPNNQWSIIHALAYFEKKMFCTLGMKDMIIDVV